MLLAREIQVASRQGIQVGNAALFPSLSLSLSLPYKLHSNYQ